MNKLELQITANEVRKGIVTAVHSAKAGHPGGSLSAADIFTYLYFEEMNIDPKNPKKPDRDRFVLSKGHTAPGLYSTLAQRGYFPVEDLKTLRHLGSYLQGHPDMKRCPGIDISTGSLGQGISCAVGMALAAKRDNRAYITYTLLGDGECDEGQVWEAAQAANKYKLDNLIIFVDNNHLQNDGFTEDIMPTEDLREKFEAFGFEAIRINGHDMQEIVDGTRRMLGKKNGKPKCVVCNTIKGKGVSFMENIASWHGTAPDDKQYRQAMEELEGLDE